MRASELLYFNLAGDCFHPKAYEHWAGEQLLLSEGADALKDYYLPAFQAMQRAADDAICPPFTRWVFNGDRYAVEYIHTERPVPGFHGGIIIDADLDHRVFYLSKLNKSTWLIFLPEEY